LLLTAELAEGKVSMQANRSEDAPMPDDTAQAAETALLPPLTDAMTAADLAAHITALAQEAGADWRASTVFLSERGDYRDPNPASLKLEVPGRNWRDNPRFDAPTWPEAFALARAWIATHATVNRDNRIRAMALAIIDLTDQFGRCDRAMLTRRDFSGAEIDDLKDSACVRASEMSANSPFEVLS